MLFVVRRTCDKDDDNIEHHLAAIQIQEMFRKRRAAKEGKHATRLPRPFVQQVFCGHRNSRTMVNFAGQFSCRIFYAVSSNKCATNFHDFITCVAVMLAKQILFFIICQSVCAKTEKLPITN